MTATMLSSRVIPPIQATNLSPWINPQLKARIDRFVSDMDLSQRVQWLTGQGVNQDEIFDATLGTDDDLLRFTTDHAQHIISKMITGRHIGVPEWLK